MKLQKQSQSGSAHLLIIIVLVIALIGALGFAYYSNFIQPKTNNENVITKDSKDDKSNTDNIEAIAPAKVVNNFLTSYLSYMSLPTTDSHNEESFASESTVLTEDYKDSITNPSGMIYVSPIILAQNMFKGFTVGDATITSTSSSVPVSLDFGGSKLDLIYNLVIVENAWKINGVSGA